MKIVIAILAVMLVILGFFTFRGDNATEDKKVAKLEVIEKVVEFDAPHSGYGVVGQAVCPSPKRVISGSCTTDDSSKKLLLINSYITKSNESVKNNNAFLCEYSSPSLGHFKFTSIANCQ